MKIGILTYHYTSNYGGILQAYALQETLRILGHDANIINCVPSYYKPSWKEYIPHRIILGDLCRLLVKWKYGDKTKLQFDRFRCEYLKLTPLINERLLSTINNEFDAIITGSDQVWCLSQHFRKIYFINWQPSFPGKRISYAPCCSVNIIKKTNIPTVNIALHAFDAISVRNDATYNFVHDIAGIEAPVVCDPTFLYDFKEFIDDQNIPHGPYMLTYILGDDIPGGGRKAISELRRIYGNIPIYAIISATHNPQILAWADHVLYDVTPNQWVNLIAHATCVYSDSFHAAVFSIKFQRPFIGYYASEGRGSRFIDLQKRYKLKQQIVNSAYSLCEYSAEDLAISDSTNLAIEDHINLSFNFLRRNTL